MSDEEPEPRFSKEDLFGFALLIAISASFLGHWYANDNTHFLQTDPLVVLWHALFIGIPFFLLALGGNRSWRVWLGVGAVILCLWAPVVWFMSVFTT